VAIERASWLNQEIAPLLSIRVGELIMLLAGFLIGYCVATTINA
jgi:hypothetical protein